MKVFNTEIFQISYGIMIIILLYNYNEFTSTSFPHQSCFHKHPWIFIGGFLVPMLMVILLNVFVLCIVVFILVRHTKRTVERHENSLTPATVFRLATTILGVMTIFGVMWIFAAFTFQTGEDQTLRDTFQTLFTFFATFQGVFIFIFFCALNKIARESWKEALSFGRYRSKVLHRGSVSKSSTKIKSTKSVSVPTSTVPPTPVPWTVPLLTQPLKVTYFNITDQTWYKTDSNGNCRKTLAKPH